jgi:hypothetical protein
MHYHDPNTYYYEIRIENKDAINIIKGNVIANTRPKALDKIVREYNCDRNLIKLKCVPCLEISRENVYLCPKCKIELTTNGRGSLQLIYPPIFKSEYICPKCGYKTTI